MRCAYRNSRLFKYQHLLNTSAELVDIDGNFTGESGPLYGEVQTGRANITQAKGKAAQAAFGIDLQYDKVLITDKDYGLKESSRLWVDDLDAEKPDYIIKRIAQSINSYTIAISKVSVK